MSNLATTTSTTVLPSKTVDMNAQGSYNNGNQVVSQIFLTPIAAPGILGFYSFAVAAVILGTRWAHWYGNSATMVYLWPMFLIFGITQIICGMFCFKARDNLGTAFHGIWGSFFLALGVFYLYASYGILPILLDGTRNPETAMWFAVLAAITAALLAASFAQSLGTVVTTLFTCAAAVVASIAIFKGHTHTLMGAGWIFFFAGLMAFYTASCWLLEYQYMRPILPLNNFNVYNRFRTLNRGMLYDPVVVNRGLGEPGVMKGQ